MLKNNLLILLIISLLCTGCATGINSRKKVELAHFEARGLAIQKKNPTLAAALGILPGGGSFYTGEYPLGVLNLLFWPVSILWDPFSGANSAQRQNYVATKEHVRKLKEKEITIIDEQRIAGTLDDTSYILAMKAIERKYSVEDY